MDSIGNTNLFESFKRLLAAHQSQEARLEEYARIVASRDQEIEMLQSMLAEAREYRSNADASLVELNDFKQTMAGLNSQVAAAGFMVSGKKPPVNNNNISVQLENLKTEHTHLQTQFADLQMQLLEMNNRNLLLQQKTSRIAELESLLANTMPGRE